jgi:hypothetical protein
MSIQCGSILVSVEPIQGKNQQQKDCLLIKWIKKYELLMGINRAF